MLHSVYSGTSLNGHPSTAIRLSTLCSKNYLICYSPMLLNVAYYAIDSYPLFHIMLYKKSNEIFIVLHKIKVHSSSSQAIQYNCTTDY